MRSVLLECRHLTFQRGKSSPILLKGLDLSFSSRELVGIFGVNGAGKTTLLRVLGGMIKPTQGQVLLSNKDMKECLLSEISRHIAYVPQMQRHYFPYSARRMIELGRVPHSGLLARISTEDEDIVQSVITRLGLESVSQKMMMELSGGERQKVIFARALVQNTPILLLDEPMSGLDYGAQYQFLNLLAELMNEGRLIIMTSHRPEELLPYGTRALILEQGIIRADGDVRSVLTAENLSHLYNIPMQHIDHGKNRLFYYQDFQK
ncbi:ABC transporter ATP-binding protein [Swingsia samuiensis]|uniref:ABC transporter ATP-binding protein n=1 Tax=Swingsia samuiensis TaxID=1293412 RepID=A0A4Y6UJP1_9PROT|nr:ABC transporter ATP-binding protein [Swingsia samuiensis]QDH16611.1 ABC transporter ATP-binding protein [Swingsia samuiensis]